MMKVMIMIATKLTFLTIAIDILIRFIAGGDGEV